MELPFKGTASTWWSADGRVTPVTKLEDAHLVNIFTSLRQIAREELLKDNPYSPIPVYGSGYVKSFPFPFSTRQLEIWLLENCITYPALKREAIKRNIWDPHELKASYIGLPHRYPMRGESYDTETQGVSYNIGIQSGQDEQSPSPRLGILSNEQWRHERFKELEQKVKKTNERVDAQSELIHTMVGKLNPLMSANLLARVIALEYRANTSHTVNERETRENTKKLESRLDIQRDVMIIPLRNRVDGLEAKLDKINEDITHAVKVVDSISKFVKEKFNA